MLHIVSTLRRGACLAIAALLLTACATTPPEPVDLPKLLADHGYQLGERVDRIQRFRINDWRYLDSQHVIIGGGVSRYYLLTLAARCVGLSSSQDLGFTTTAGDLTRFDRLVVRGGPGGGDRCTIADMHALSTLEE